MTEPMMITKNMRNDREKKVGKNIENINKDIKRATAKGLHECYFACSKSSYSEAPFYKEVREKFESHGYRIKPTGFIDGVWQRTEHIEW